MIWKILIVDDEPLARVRMRNLLLEYPQDIEIIGEAGSGEEAIQKIRSLSPDLVFLDIQMPDINAFDVLNSLNEEEIPLVVFTTAFDDYALRAYEENTIDYLLKPIEDERLSLTMEKLRKQAKAQVSTENDLLSSFSWDKFKQLVAAEQPFLSRIQVRIGDRTILVNVDEVIRFQSEEKYTMAYTLTNQYLIDTPLVELEAKLNPQQFVRVHRAHLVAIDYIAEIHRAEAGRLCIILKDKAKTMISVSRNFVKRVRHL
ncbi:MAG TPA: LytTR family transcriptional regulator DNA-binding domain-containing protein [Fibrobacteraceae bacterium]|nr:LytTR family transcriptional regulator DNA-binding domain-containing protein [Fibrobacteraceae bacterium]